MTSLFDHPAEQPEAVEGATHAALLGDGSPVRTEPEAAEELEAAGVPVAPPGLIVGHGRIDPIDWPDRCPSCGVALPDPSHPVDASLRNRPPPP